MITVGTKIVYNRIPQYSEKTQAGAAMVVQMTTFEIEREAKESMSGPKSGRVYPRTGGNYHQASAPGEAPAVDTGLLVNSIQSGFVNALLGIVSTNTEYAPMLEFGTSRMAARPFFGPAAEAWRDEFTQAMRKVLSG